MIFFPGEKFSNDSTDEESQYLYVKTVADETGVSSYAKLTYNGKTVTSEKRVENIPERTKERTLKLAVGLAVVNCGVELVGYRPAWGMLVGVRPSKVATEMLNSGLSKSKVKKILTNDYLVIPKKASLAVDVALYEKKITGKSTSKDCSLYISIPFCPSRCTYCSFVSYTSSRLLSLIPAYLERLLKDIDTNFRIINDLGLNLKTVYIGGGTPTILDEKMLEILLANAQKEITRVINGCQLSVIDYADVPVDTSYPNVEQNTFIGFFLGIVFGIAVVFFRELFDTRIKDEEDLKNKYGIIEKQEEEIQNKSNTISDQAKRIAELEMMISDMRTASSEENTKLN
jgi:organic radical activating enzyme